MVATVKPMNSVRAMYLGVRFDRQRASVTCRPRALALNTGRVLLRRRHAIRSVAADAEGKNLSRQ